MYSPRRTGYISPAAMVEAPAIAGADVAAGRIDSRQTRRFAHPTGADAEGSVESSTELPAAVEPSTVAAHKLAHRLILLYGGRKKSLK